MADDDPMPLSMRDSDWKIERQAGPGRSKSSGSEWTSRPADSRVLPGPHGTLGPSNLAPPCNSVTLLALPFSMVNVNRSAGSKSTPNW